MMFTLVKRKGIHIKGFTINIWKRHCCLQILTNKEIASLEVQNFNMFDE